MRRSIPDLLTFESPGTVHLLCCNQVRIGQGREALATFVTSMFGDTLDEETMGRIYLDVSGSVVEYRFPAGTDDDRSAGGGDPVGPQEVQVAEHGADGAATQTIHAEALLSLQANGDGSSWYGEDLGAAKGLTDRYLAAWSGRDGTAVGGLYAKDAMVLDSLLGVRLTGRDAIGSYAAQHGGARLRQDSIPGGGGPGLYGFWREYRSHLTVYVTYTGDDGNQCPGGVTTELQIEQGQIVAERRYHDVASMRRCVDGADLPDGWWAHAVIPEPIQDRVTGTVTAAGQRIEVHNGTAAADDLVRWAVERFPTADLTAPKVTSVAFGEQAHQAQCSGDDRGLALKIASGYRIYLCLTVDGTAPAFARELMLHELAHVWMWQHLGEPTQRQFTAVMGLPTWDGFDVRWEQRGIENAAAIIAWGLGEEPQSRILAGRSCTELAAGFELLTGATPLQPPCTPSQ